MMQVHTTEIFKRFGSLANSFELFLPKEEHFIHNKNSYCAKFARQSFEILQASKLQEAGVVQSVVNTAWAGRCGVRIPLKKTLFSKTSRPVLGPTQPPVQWVVGFFPGDKAADA